MEPRQNTKKITLLLSSFALASFVFFFVPNFASAAYSADAVSKDNSMQAGSIDLEVNPGADTSMSKGALATNDTIYMGEVENKGTSALRYRIEIIADEDADFCQDLALQAKRDGDAAYTGPLSGFSYSAKDSLEKGKSEKWSFVITLPPGTSSDHDGSSCWNLFRFKAWQGELESPATGWTDEIGLMDASTDENQTSAPSTGETPSLEDDGTTTKDSPSDGTPSADPIESPTSPADDPVTPPTTNDRDTNSSPTEGTTDVPKIETSPKSDDDIDSKKDEKDDSSSSSSSASDSSSDSSSSDSSDSSST